MGRSIPISEVSRFDLIKEIKSRDSEIDALVRKLVIQYDRIDLLAEVLGYSLQPFHKKMLQWQFLHIDNLVLAFRGAGKSTACTITKIIHNLLKNANLRIVIASKTTSNAQTYLQEIKQHFELNDRFIEIFGEHYHPRKCRRWNETVIDIATRTIHRKEANITCTGIESTLVGKHFDQEYSDDLVDDSNSRTQYMRDGTTTWYYSILDPTIEPPNEYDPLIGQRHRVGTRYHYDDQYGRWMKGPLKEHTLVIPALDEHDRSPWPEKWPPEEFERRKENAGTIIFNAQYQCDTEAMKGEIFQFDDCVIVEDYEMPDINSMRKIMGVDLAISERETSDCFALVVIAVDKLSNVWVIDYYEGHKRFGQQLKLIKEYAHKWDVDRVGIETNAYQLAQAQALEDDVEEDALADGMVKKINTHKDKIAEAWKLTPMFERKNVKIHISCTHVRDCLVLFPSAGKDVFDALKLAIRTSKKRKRKVRESEPGII